MSIAELIKAVESGTFLMDVFEDGRTERIAYEAFGGSLNDAKALHEALLPGWFPGLSQNVHSGFWFAWVQTKDEKHFSATEADPARAWLLAILRALEQEGRE